MRVVVTGGAGFIGSVLVQRLVGDGHEVLVVDELGRDQKFRNLSGVAFADYFEKDDFFARLEGRGALPAAGAVFHLGACSATTEADGSFLMRNNYVWSKAVTGWCLAKDIRLVYASSAATYGAGEHGYDDGPGSLALLRPLNKYAFSKQAVDLWAAKSGALARVAALKYFNVFGPHEYHKGEMRSMALKAFEQIRDTGRVKLFQSYRPEYADGAQQRDFLYVKDAVAMTAWFLDRREANGVFNIGGGVARTWNDLARAVFAAMGKPVAIDYIEMPAEIRDAYQYSTCAAMGRLEKAGCPIRARGLEEAVADYVQHHLMGGSRYL